MTLLPKIESIFSIVTIFDKIEYKFENRIVLEVLEKLVIIATNPLVYYLICQSELRKTIIDHQVDVYRHWIWSFRRSKLHLWQLSKI